MKTLSKILLGSLLLSGVQFALSGCASEGSANGSVYYGSHHRDPWFHDDPWMDGHHYGHYREPSHVDSVDIYISPPRPPSPHIRLP